MMKGKSHDYDLAMDSICQGDYSKLQEIYVDFSSPIFRYALSITKDLQLAEDIMQDTFISIIKYAKSYKPNTNYKAWVFTIAKNLCNKALVKGKTISLDDETFNDSIALSTKDQYLESLQALNVLKTLEREIVVLFVFDEFSQVEISKILGISYISVRSKYANAMKKLKKYYGSGGNYEK